MKILTGRKPSNELAEKRAYNFLENEFSMVTYFYDTCSENPRFLNLGMNGILSKRSQVEPGEAEQIPT